jgi:hypothetical protein
MQECGHTQRDIRPEKALVRFGCAAQSEFSILMLNKSYSSIPPIGDGRPAIAEIYRSCDELLAAGWQKVEITAQAAAEGERLPIYAYFNSVHVDYVLIGGIHGREPAGAIANSHYAGKLQQLGRERKILLLPLLNPWGYFHHIRYGPNGQSVSDSDHCLGRLPAAASPEAAAITAFVLNTMTINPGAAVLDLHEDPVYEAPDYHLEGWGSYLYISGENCLSHPIAKRVVGCLKSSSLPLIQEGTTRFGERLVEGIIVNTEDGSIDELLYKLRACCPVITAENILHAADSPPLAERVATYLKVLDAFFGVSG